MPSFKQPQKCNSVPEKIIQPQKPSQAYQVAYSRDIRKKKKQMLDGVLITENERMKLFDMESKLIYNGANQICEDITQYYIGQFFIEILNEVPFDQYKSGKIFIEQSTPINIQPIKQIKPLKKQTPEINQRVQIIDGFFIDQFLFKNLREHQLEGVKFMLECIIGRKNQKIQGCILADSMGLGKTLQAISLIWILIQSHELQKIAIVCPVSLIENWEKEIKKWLGPIRLSPLIAIGSKDEVIKQVKYFLYSPYNLILTSYETFRNISNEIDQKIQLLICDEGHRLKNSNIKTVQTINQLKCKKRIVLSGTPIQNNMKEFYACCDFVNPGIFSSYKTFKQVFQDPIEKSMEKKCSEQDIELGRQRSLQLSELTSQFILRRRPDLLSKFLPSKFEYLMLCTMTQQQEILYKKCLTLCPNSIMIQLNLLRKLTTHPTLLQNDENEAIQQLKITDYSSTKFHCLKILIDQCKEQQEKVVINSYYGQTLDLIEEHLIQWNITFLRLDGKVPQNKRMNLVETFNHDDTTAFLLNGKSGGTGLNLVGANKMICIEVDWNPANDAQVMGRIWRDGQMKQVHIYRLISCGTYEEKIMQRQLTKENLSQNIVDDKSLQNQFTTDELKDLLTYNNHQKCQIFQESDKIQSENDFPNNLFEHVSLVKINKTSSSIQNVFNNQDTFIQLEKQIDEQDQQDQQEEQQINNENQENVMINDQNIFQKLTSQLVELKLQNVEQEIKLKEIIPKENNQQFPLAQLTENDLSFLD